MALHGPKIADFREQAKTRVMYHFVSLGERDKVPPTLRAMYALKVQQATAYIDAIDAGKVDYQSLNRCIETDAEARGYTPYQMATIILFMAGQSLDLEAQRLTVNMRIEEAPNASAVKAILDEMGLSLNDPYY